jgi:hypothetical protein
MVIRVGEYTIEDRPGSGELFCLITTILDHEFAPAVELATAYHQRWEIELSFDEIETHQTGHHRVPPAQNTGTGSNKKSGHCC